MTTLIVGGSGATGKLLVGQLLEKGHQVKVIVRPAAKLPESWSSNQNLTIIRNEISELDVQQMAAHLKDCDAVASCLGHNLSFAGIYGKPRKLVTNAVRLICKAIDINSSAKPIRLVLMNTVGNRNRDIAEPVSFGQRAVISLIRILLPPHTDNEQAAEFLSKEVGQNNKNIEWSAVRPDTLIDEKKVSEYKIYPSPIRSAIFNPGKTSRVNVADFMGRLMVEDGVWGEWKGQMPVVYNVD